MATTSPTKPAAPIKSKGKLEDQAAIAALYVTRNDAAAKKNQEHLDSNNRLSSAGKSMRPDEVVSEQRTTADALGNRSRNISQIRTATRPSKLSIIWIEG